MEDRVYSPRVNQPNFGAQRAVADPSITLMGLEPGSWKLQEFLSDALQLAEWKRCARSLVRKPSGFETLEGCDVH